MLFFPPTQVLSARVSEWEQKRVRCLWNIWKVLFVSHHLCFLCTDCSQSRKLYRFNSTGSLNSDLPTVPFTVWSDRQRQALVYWCFSVLSLLLLQNKPNSSTLEREVCVFECDTGFILCQWCATWLCFGCMLFLIAHYTSSVWHSSITLSVMNIFRH